MAPEIFNHQDYTKPVDIWAIGVVLYQLLTNEQPFNLDSILFNEYNFNLDNVTEGVSSFYKELVL